MSISVIEQPPVNVKDLVIPEVTLTYSPVFDPRRDIPISSWNEIRSQLLTGGFVSDLKLATSIYTIDPSQRSTFPVQFSNLDNLVKELNTYRTHKHGYDSFQDFLEKFNAIRTIRTIEPNRLHEIENFQDKCRIWSDFILNSASNNEQIAIRGVIRTAEGPNNTPYVPKNHLFDSYLENLPNYFKLPSGISVVHTVNLAVLEIANLRLALSNEKYLEILHLLEEQLDEFDIRSKGLDLINDPGISITQKVEILRNLSIIGAERIEFTDHGLVLHWPGEEKEVRNETPPLPTFRAY